MDEDEAKSIASEWIRRLEASLLAKVSDNQNDNTTEDHCHHRHHDEDDIVTNSYSYDQLDTKHIDTAQTTSDEKIHHEVSSEDLISQNESITNEPSTSNNKTIEHVKSSELSCKATRSPRIDLEDLRKKRLERFVDVPYASSKDDKENGDVLSPQTAKKEEEPERTSIDMFRYEASSVSVEDRPSLTDNHWDSYSCKHSGTSYDEDDKLRLELWGIRDAVESGQIDITSYLRPSYSKSLEYENGPLEESQLDLDNSIKESNTLTGSYTPDSPPRCDNNHNISPAHKQKVNSSEDFTSFSFNKPSPSVYGNVGPSPQIEGKLYNGFETSDSESSINMLSLRHKGKLKTNHQRSDVCNYSDEELKSSKGKQKILSELTEFLDSERNSKRVVKKSESESISPKLSLEDSTDLRSYGLLKVTSSSPPQELVHHEDMYSVDQQDLLPGSTYDNNPLVSPESLQDRTLSAPSESQVAKICNACNEVNSKAANWCIECGTALIRVEPILLSLEQQMKYDKQCKETKNFMSEALNTNKQEKKKISEMSKKEKDLYKDVLRLSKEVDQNSGFSNESLRSNVSNYKRRWLKSSIAWSTFEPQELSKPSSIVKENENGGKVNGTNNSKNTRNQSSCDLSVIEKLRKKNGHKNGHLKSGSRHRTTSASNSADDYDTNNYMPINLERPRSAKSNSKTQRTKPQKRPESAKPRTHSKSPIPDPNTDGFEGVQNSLDFKESSRKVVCNVPQLNLNDVGSYDRILTLIRSQRDSEPIPYLYLPEEIILQIFSNLSINDLVSCARVCWQFHRIGMDETLWKTIAIRKNRKICDEWLESIGGRHPTSLTISQCSGNNVTSNGLRSLFWKCSTTLEEVDFSGCNGGELIGESVLLHISARCAGVVSVDMSWTNVSDNGVQALADSLTRLECLCLNGCQAITDKSLTCVAEKHGQSLRIFEVFGCFNLTPAGLLLFANKCNHLQTLNIGQCHKMTDPAIGKLVSHLTELENLDLRGCKKIRDSAVKKIVRHCPLLTSLVLANCPLITDTTLTEISTNLQGIKSLDICGCSNITDAGVRALARCCHKLELLDLSSTGNSVTSKSVMSLGNYCSQSLRVLKLSFCADITVNTVNQLAKNCKKLTLLHLYGCKRIKELDRVKNSNPRLVIEG